MMKNVAVAAMLAASVALPMQAQAQSAKPEVTQSMIYEDAASSGGDILVGLIFLLIVLAIGLGGSGYSVSA